MDNNDVENGPLGLTCEDDDCEQIESQLYYCPRCMCYFCDDCWLRQSPHRPGKAAATRHEKVGRDVYLRLRETFDPPSDAMAQDKLHKDDEETTWFAVKRDPGGKPRILYDSGRYASLIAPGSSGGGYRFPALVSFVGQTGAGKSTLIKMLIERRLPPSHSGRGSFDTNSGRDMFPTPVVGSYENNNVPTSGDVHLYADPLSYFDERPIFYVDSEGLEGGEKEPIAERSRDSYQKFVSGGKGKRSSRTRIKLTKKWRFSREISRNIEWADAPEKEKRQFAVTHFYPRILYTFSDVLVFVLRNPRTFESVVVTRLIDWAAEVLNASTNQPRLPHAIIVVNASHSKTKAEQWDVDYATESLLDSVSKATPSERDAELVKKLMKHWHLPEKPVRSVRDLLLCYYSSVRVVLIPDDEQYLKVEEQTEKLHQEIRSACEASMMSRKKARMLMNADELDELFQAAFDHFSRSINSPFDLIQAARKNVPIPRDFAGNITKVAVAVRDSLESSQGRTTAHEIFEPLSLMVASCVLLECTRSNWKGSTLEFFNEKYKESCKNALEDFCKQFWPCEFELGGPRGKGRCVNTLERHQKGHQLKGKQIPGDYMASFTFHGMLPAWLDWIQFWLEQFQAYLLQNPRTREEDMVAQMHQHNLHRFFDKVGGSLGYLSHSVCLCCMRELPEHPLQCGHVLCTPCMKTYGDLESRLRSKGAFASRRDQVSLSRCPLHSSHRTGFEFVEPRYISLKPDWAGVRLLCLDGGGIRGIVELEVLRHIEAFLGGNLPIQSFFDLIVGTSTGGIIAVGLGVKNWSVSTCIQKFLTLADKAFTRRLIGIHDIPIVGRAGRKYRTKPFEEVLKTTFEDEYFFGGHYLDPSNYKTRVALTSTTATGSTPVVLANYNRPDESPSTEFLRPDYPTHELKIWEAIRATTAAPGYFKPFIKPETSQRFVDGAVYHNNPVYVAFEESKLIWPDVCDRLPDIILSIGTGHNRLQTDISKPGLITEHSPRVSRVVRIETSTGPDNDIYRVLQNFKMMFTRMSNVLSSHIRWISFKREVTLPIPQEKMRDAKRRLQRIDPRLGYDPPSLDDKSKINHLKKTIDQVLQQNPMYRAQIQTVGRRLVASSFYFEKIRHDGIGSGYYEFDGRIFCRFPNNSHELSHLGEFLSSQRPQGSQGRYYPFFRIEQNGRSGVDMEISPQVLDKMSKGLLSIFDFDRVIYRVSNKNAEVNLSLALWNVEENRPDIIPISGFPRRIVAESNQAMPTSPNFGTPQVSASEYWKCIEGSGCNYPKPMKPDPPSVENKKAPTMVSKQNALGILQDPGRSWEFRRVLRRRPRVANMQKTGGIKLSLSKNLNNTDSDKSEENRRDGQATGDLPVLQMASRTTLPKDLSATSSPIPLEHVDDDDDGNDEEGQLNRAIQLSFDVNHRYTSNGTNLVELERALALSLLEGRAITPSSGLEYDLVHFDREED